MSADKSIVIASVAFASFGSSSIVSLKAFVRSGASSPFVEILVEDVPVSAVNEPFTRPLNKPVVVLGTAVISTVKLTPSALVISITDESVSETAISKSLPAADFSKAAAISAIVGFAGRFDPFNVIRDRVVLISSESAEICS